MARENEVVILVDDTPLSQLTIERGMPYLWSLPDGKWTRFTQGTLACPYCGSSRTSLFTGVHAKKHGAKAHGAWDTSDMGVHDLANNNNMLARWMADAGYINCLCGKYNNRYPWARGDAYIPPGWHWWHAFLEDAGAGVGHETHNGPAYSNYVLRENELVVSYGTTDTWTTTGADATGRTGTTDYSTDVFNLRALRFLNQRIQATRPFMLWLSVNASHGPTVPALRHFRQVTDGAVTNGLTAFTSVSAAFTANDVGKMLRGLNIPAGTTIVSVVTGTQVTMSAAATATGSALTVAIMANVGNPVRANSFNEADISDKPAWVQGKFPSLSLTDQIAQDEAQQAQWCTLRAVDELLRDVVTTLKAQGVFNNTKITVLSDNGWCNGEHRVIRKNVPYEPSIRSEIWVRHPLAAGNRTSTALVQNVDVAPTICETATVRPSRPFDGQSFLPLILQTMPDANWREAVYLENYNVDFIGGTAERRAPAWKAVLSQTAKYIEGEAWADGLGGSWPAWTEYYDLSTDPDEMSNKIADAAYVDAIASMAAKLARLKL